ncbi:MAG: hypothetical protein HKP61_16770 [Dactylosporangium sp.]|nr:hypothetical protein [Dactylosporangium sp.]NNJ62561.1 hypothetical protein [Dactylosporangium sp.]
MTSSLLPTSSPAPEVAESTSAGRHSNPGPDPAPAIRAGLAERHRREALAVVAGVPGTAPAAVAAALSDVRDLRIAAYATGRTWTVLRAGTRTHALACVPGQRRACATGPAAPDVQCTGGRQPRRVVIRHPSPLLASISLACPPPIASGDQPAADLFLDAVSSATAVVFVLTSAPLEPGHLQLLRAAAARAEHVAFVVTPTGADDPAASPPEHLVATTRAVLSEHVGALAAAGWYTPGQFATLATQLAAWGAPATAPPAGRPGRQSAPTVPPGDRRWRPVLTRAVDSRSNATTATVRQDCATIVSRCIRELGVDRSCAELPDLLDAELHALSVRTTRRIETDVLDVTREVCAALLGVRPNQEILRRARVALRRAVEAGDHPVPARALLLTTTAGVATVSGRAAVHALETMGLPTGGTALVPPIGVAVNTSCYHLWQRRHELLGVSPCRAWLQRALTVVQTQVLAEADLRYAALVAGLEAVATDAVDHGVLLT